MDPQSGTPQACVSLSARFFERVVTAVGHAVVTTDLDGHVRYWNPAAERLYGYRAVDALGRHLVDLIVPGPERVQAVDRIRTLSAEPCSSDWEVQDRSGRALTVQMTLTLILDDDDRPAGILWVSDDVTSRRQAERDARRLAAIVESSADAIVEIDVTGVIRSANAAVATVFGYDPSSLLGRDAALLTPPGQEISVKTVLEGLQAGGSPGVLLTKRLHADGTLIDVALRVSAVRDDAGHVVGVSGIIRDVTEETRIRTELVASEHRFRARFDQVQVPQAMVSLDGTLAAVNDALCQLLGRERADLEGHQVRELCHANTVHTLCDQFSSVLAGSVSADTWESALAGWEDSVIPVVIHAALLRETDGAPHGVAVFIQDLSALRRAERTLTRRAALFEALEKQSSDWATVIDAEAVIQYISCSDAFACDPRTLIGRSSFDVIHPDDLAEARRTVERVAGSAAASETALFRIADAAGRWRWLENVITNYLGDPDIAGIVCNGREVTSRVEAEQELRERALRDDLTGVANRTLVDDRIAQLISGRAGSGDRPVSVIFADLDQFKLINDTWGHTAGDQLLVQVADRLARAVRSSDTVARFGGDEFIVICEGTGQADAEGIAKRLQATLSSPFDLDGRRVHVRASMGVAVSPPHPAADLLRFADAAMYAAKSIGPGRTQVFDVALADDAADRLTLGNDLRDALARDELTMHYQPVVDLATGSLVGLEALARWSHPVRGPVSPTQFVHVAETSGQAPALNRWTVRRASRDASLLRDLMPTVPRIAVNVSLRHLMDADLETDVLSAVSDGEMSADGLMLEITESVLMDNPDQTRGLLDRLRAHGVETAIDDFGTGYSSLGHLSQLPVTTLKIDRSFIRDITENPDALAITTSVIELARSMRLVTIAEGVETIGQLALLRDLGCWAAQGFLWSPPLAPHSLAHTVNRLPDRRFDVKPAETPTR